MTGQDGLVTEDLFENLAEYAIWVEHPTRSIPTCGPVSSQEAVEHGLVVRIDQYFEQFLDVSEVHNWMVSCSRHALGKEL